MRTTRPRIARPRPRLGVEALEDRLAPATFTVTNTNDSGAGSLRAAIVSANTTTDADTIVFDSSFNTTRTITLTGGQLSITQPLTVTGPGKDLLSVSGNKASRVFWVASAGVSLSGLTITLGNGADTGDTSGHGGGIFITNGAALTLTDAAVTASTVGGNGGGVVVDGNLSTLTAVRTAFTGNTAHGGGGLYVEGTVTLTECNVVGNTAVNGGGLISSSLSVTLTECNVADNTATEWGGGAYNGGALTIVDSTVAGNKAAQGGGVYTSGNLLTVVRSAITGNTATGDGGGVRTAGKVVDISTSTVAGNTATFGGGLYIYGGSATVAQSTVAGNTASANGGGVWVDGPLTLAGSVVAGNAASAEKDVGKAGGRSVAVRGSNVVQDGTVTGAGVLNVDPKLGPLADNGGPTQTHSIPLDSPALNAGAAADLLVGPVSVSSSTAATDYAPASNLIGSYAGLSAAPTLATVGAVTQTQGEGHWVTAAYPGDYFANGGAAPVLTFGLGGQYVLTEVVTWFYRTAGSGNRNWSEAKTLEVAFSTDGGATFGAPVTVTRVPNGANATRTALGGSYTADAVRVTVTDNFYEAGGADGGDRVSLGEVRFVGTAATDQRGVPLDAQPDLGAYEFVNRAPAVGDLSNATIAENAADHAAVGTLSGSDPDYLDVVTLSLPDAQDNAHFELSGVELRAKAGFDFEARSAYTVVVRATDLGGLTADRTFAVTVDDVNEAPTGIALSNAAVAENKLSGTTVGVLSGTDPDAGDKLTYTLPANTGDNGQFAIDAVDGVTLKTAAMFDFEKKPAYTITVRATDKKELTFDRSFTIAVEDGPEGPKAILPATLSVAENKGAGAEVAVLDATDDDKNETFTFALVPGSGGDDNDAFLIDADGKTLRAKAGFNYEIRNTYLIRLTVTDKDGLTHTEERTVDVTDANDDPTGVALDKTEVAENEPAGTAVGNLSATDPDAGATHTFALVAGDGDADNGSFQIVGNELRTKAVFDFEDRATYKVRVRAIDQADLTADQSFTITVTNANEAPTGITPASLSVAENAGTNATVAALGGVDPDAGETFTFALVGGDGADDNAAFNIDADGKTLRATAGLDYELRKTYLIRLKVTDKGGLTFEEARTVAVEDRNDAPTGVALDDATVAENEPAGTAVGNLSATDPDAGATHTFALVAGEGDADNALFEVAGAELRTKAGFDFEDRATYKVRVRATDQAGLTADQSFTIAVTDVNEAPTGVGLTPAAGLPDVAPAGTVLGTLSATDPDAGDAHTFALVPGEGDNARFEVVGNQLRAKQEVDLRDGRSYTAVVTATDGGGLPVTGDVTVSLAAEATVESAGLTFSTTTNFNRNGSVRTATGTTTVGFVLGDGTYRPLLRVVGTVAVDTDARSFRINGSVEAAKSATEYVGILAAGTARTFSIPDLFPGGASPKPSGSGLFSGRAFEAVGINFQYDGLVLSKDGGPNGGPEARFRGKLSLPGGLTVAVSGDDFVGVGTAGVRLTGVVATVDDAAFSLAGFTLDARQLAARYVPADDAFTLSGPLVLSAAGLGSLTLTLGGGGTAGFVVTAGEVTAFDATAAIDSQVAGGALKSASATPLRLIYDHDADEFGVSGSATLTFDAGRVLTLALGTEADPGLVFEGGEFTRFVAVGNLSTGLAGGTLTATDVTAAYTAPSGARAGRFGLSGTAALVFDSGRTVTLALGTAADPGLVIEGGTITRVAATGAFTTTLAGAAFEGTGLGVVYAAADGDAPARFAVSGSATLTFDTDRVFTLTLGSAANPGLVIQDNKVFRLSATTALPDFKAGGLTLTAASVGVTYTADPAEFTVTGAATLTATSFGPVSVRLGGPAVGDNPGSAGLVIRDGKLAALDLTVTGAVTVGGLTFAATGLRLAGDLVAERFAVEGETTTTVTDVGTVRVTLGGDGTDGLVFDHGELVALTAAVTGTLTVRRVRFAADDLVITYRKADDEFALTGDATLKADGVADIAVEFGGDDTDGLVVKAGVLDSLDMTVTGKVSVGGLTFEADDLEVSYDAATRTFALTGTTETTVDKVGEVEVEFGGDDTDGLVIEDGAVSSLDMTVTGEITVGGLVIAVDGTQITYAGGAYTLTGPASITLGRFGVVGVRFGEQDAAGNTLSTGLVVRNGTLASLDLTIDSDLAFSGVTLSTDGLRLVYNADAGLFTATGKATAVLPKAGTVQVTLGGAATPGLVITNGALSSLSMTVDSEIVVAKVTFKTTALTLAYTDADGGRFAVTGTASMTAGELADVKVKFGSDSPATDGLVFTGGTLDSLDVAVTSTLTVGGLTFSTDDLQFTYAAADETFTLTGGASFRIGTGGSSSALVEVQFGSDGTDTDADGNRLPETDGLVVKNGSLESLDVAVTSRFKVASVEFGTDGLRFTYDVPTKTFTLSGGASFALAVGAGTVAVDVQFGSKVTDTDADGRFLPATKGLVVKNGSLESLDIAVTSKFELASVTFGTNALRFTYTAADQTFTLTGGAFFTMKAPAVTVQVQFGSTAADVDADGRALPQTAGLVVRAGKLVSLDIALTSKFTLATVEFGTDALRFTYDVPTETFTLSGGAFFNMKAPAVKVEVQFGTAAGELSDDGKPMPATKGLVITAGKLVSLDIAVTSSFVVGGLTFGTDGLRFTYDDPSKTFTLSGGAFVKSNVFSGPEVAVYFGGVLNKTDASGVVSQVKTRGLVVTDGDLKYLDVSVTSRFQVGSLTFFTKALRFTYTPAINEFTLGGTAGADIAKIGTVAVRLGDDGQTQGLVIRDGQLVSLNATLSAALGVGGLNFANAELTFTYDKATETFTLSGNSSFRLGSVLTLDVQLGGTYKGPDGGTVQTKGLVVQNGELKSLDMSIRGTLQVGGLTFLGGNFVMRYDGDTKTFTMTGGTSVTVGGVGSLSVDFGDGDSDGLVIVAGKLKTLNMKVNSNFGVTGFQLTIDNVTLAYASTSGGTKFTMKGSASLNIGLTTFSVRMGTNGGNGVVVENGELTAFDATVSVNLGIGKLFSLGSVTLSAQYSKAEGTFRFEGTADVTLSADLPDWAETFFPSGSVHIGSVTVRMFVKHGDDPASFVQFATTIAGQEVGIKVYFDGKVSLAMGDVFSAVAGAFKELGQTVEREYQKTAAALSDAYTKAANGVTGVYTIARDALNSAVDAIDAAARAVRDALANAARTVFSWFSGWGYLEGATAYYDPTGAGVYDPSYPSATTDADGRFNLELPAVPTAEGIIVVTGGVDTSTRRVNTITLTAPVAAYAITPFTTTVVAARQNDPALSVADATERVRAGLGLPAGVDLLKDDLIARAVGGSADHAAAFGRETAVSAVAHMLTDLIEARPGRTNNDPVSPLVFRALAAACDAAVDLSDPAAMAALIRDAAARAGAAFTDELVDAAAEVAAGVVAETDDLAAAATRAYAEAVVRVQTVGQTAVADGLAEAARGDRTPASLVADFTGDALDALIADGTIGVVTPPEVEADAVRAGVGYGQTNTFRFPVYLSFAGGLPGPASRPLPVSISYTTEDGTATAADGDYTPVSGVLTWTTDFAAVQYIEVPVGPGSSPTPDGYFLIRLSDVENAVLPSGAVKGEITGTTFATATALTASAGATTYGSPVLLTATVTLADGGPAPAGGAVDFYAGATLIGSAETGADGRAVLSAGDTLAPAAYALKAVYHPFVVPGGDYSSSQSADPVELAVAPRPNVITFDALADRTYGDGPLTLTASASSGLAVSFAVVSGPVTLDEDGVLTLTGAGDVTVRATQAGDRVTVAAAPIDRTFRISKARLRVTGGNTVMTYRDAVPELPYLMTGLVNGDTPAALELSDGLRMVTTATSASGVGAYPITTSVAVTQNYDLEVVDGELVVDPAAVVLTVSSASAVYGDLGFAFTYTAAGLLGGDVLAGVPVYSGYGAEPGVGSHAVTVSGPAHPNYTVSVLPGTLTVTPAPLVVAADDAEMTYGGAVPALTVRYAGFVFGQGPAALTTPPTATTAPAGSDAGTYPIAVGNAAAANYDITFAGGTLTVRRAVLTVAADDLTMTVGDPLPALTATYTGLVNGDAPADLLSRPTLSTAATGATAGTFAVAAAGAADPNYDIAHAAGVLTVARQAVWIVLTPATDYPLVGRDLTAGVAATNTHLGRPVGGRVVRLAIDGGEHGTAELDADGRTTVDLTGLPAGDHVLTVTFDGDETQAAATAELAFTMHEPLPQPAGPANAAPTGLRLVGGAVAENAAGAAVGELIGTDPDAGDLLTFAVVLDASPARFEVVGAELRTTGPLDFEAAGEHTVRVRVTDAGGLWFERDLTVTVLDASEAPTGATLSPAAVIEGAAVGTVVGVVSAADPDAGDTHTFELVDGAGGRFALDGNRVVVAGPLDFEAAAAHTIRVRVTDADGQAVEAELSVAVTDRPEVTGFAVGRGRVQRSFVRHLDVALDTAAAAAALTAPGRVKLVKRTLAGENPVAVALGAGVVSAAGRTLAFDFGAAGLGGNRNSNAADGYYTVSIDADGDGVFETDRSFYRLLGDTNGDRTVDQADVNAIDAAVAGGYFAPDLDVNGDGVVNGTDRLLALRHRGRSVAGTLRLDG